MERFTIKANKYLEKDVKGYYNCDYIGYRQKGNPDFINRLKNTTKSHSELDLVQDFLEVADRALNDLSKIIKDCNFSNPVICILPRSKSQKNYSQKQLMFKKAISSIIKYLNVEDGSEYIKRIKDTKTTHNWRLENNNGDMPYKGISKDTCEFAYSNFRHKDIILVDDIYIPIM